MRWVFIGIVVLNLVYLGWNLVGLDEQKTVSPANVAETAYPETLQLLDGGIAATGSEASSLAESSQVGGVKPGCPAVGPIADDVAAADIVTALDGAGFSASARRIELKNAPVYWVYLAPMTSRQLAEQKLRELQVKGIDSFLVASGEDVNAISLGVFANRSSALGVQSRMAAIGVNAEIREQRRDVRQRWVVISDPAAQGFLQHIPEEFAKSLQVDRFSCRPD